MKCDKRYKLTVSKKELEKLYRKDPCAERVGKKLGVSKVTILRRMKKYGIPTGKYGAKSFKDLTGKRFGRLTVIRRVENDKQRNVKWLCLCDCGREKQIMSKSLTMGFTKSCGCYHRDIIWKGVGDLSRSYWSSVLRGAKKRNLEVSVTIEDAWELFLRQKKKCAISGIDIKIVTDLTRDRNKHTASFDRIDSSKGYTKDNVQWVHRNINFAKRALSVEQFVQLCQEVVDAFPKLKFSKE